MPLQCCNLQNACQRIQEAAVWIMSASDSRGWLKSLVTAMVIGICLIRRPTLLAHFPYIALALQEKSPLFHTYRNFDILIIWRSSNTWSLRLRNRTAGNLVCIWFLIFGNRFFAFRSNRSWSFHQILEKTDPDESKSCFKHVCIGTFIFKIFIGAATPDCLDSEKDCAGNLKGHVVRKDFSCGNIRVHVLGRVSFGWARSWPLLYTYTLPSGRILRLLFFSFFWVWKWGPVFSLGRICKPKSNLSLQAFPRLVEHFVFRKGKYAFCAEQDA